MRTQPSSTSTSRKSFSIAAGAFVMMLLLSAGIMFKLNSSKNALQAERDKQLLKADSLLSVKLLLDRELLQVKETVKVLKTDNEKTSSLLSTAEKEVSAQKHTIEKLLKEKVDAELLKKQLAQIRKFNQKLQTQLDEQLQLVKSLRQENTSLKAEIASLETQKTDWLATMEKASALQAHSIKVQSLRLRSGNKYKITDRAKKVDRLTVDFILAENILAKPGNRTVGFLVVDPGGNILNSAVSSSTPGSQILFTDTKVVAYRNQSQTVSFLLEPQEKFSKGKYSINIYCDGKAIGQSEVTLR